jgi:hypothetical protein
VNAISADGLLEALDALLDSRRDAGEIMARRQRDRRRRRRLEPRDVGPAGNGTRAKATARRELIDMMQAISRTWRVIQADAPGFPNTFQMPTGKSAQALLTAARLFAGDAERVRSVFIAHAMPQTFVDEFKRLLDAYEQAVRAGAGTTRPRCRCAGRGRTSRARCRCATRCARGCRRVGRAAAADLSNCGLGC